MNRRLGAAETFRLEGAEALAKILIVDDEQSLVHSVQLQLSRAGHECHCADTVAGANEILQKLDPELGIIDIRLPDGNGMDLIRRVRADDRHFPIVVLTAFGSIPNAVSAMREGANDYIEKPVDLDQLSFIVERNLETQRLRGRVELYERLRWDDQGDWQIIGESEAFRRAMALARRVAQPGVESASAMPIVLITGETGTGKDLLARHIHAIGPLAAHPFVHVDCTALPRELIESELFGHERGAFTDAKSTKRGLLEIASEGTVFLNEIGELAVELQAKLLSMLERKSFRRVGGTRDINVNVRIIAATNADLKERVAARTFREDLFYRLNVFNIHLPPVRERGDDVLLLVDYFAGKLCKKYRKEPMVLSKDARQALVNYYWPGNVREVLHVMERAALLNDGGRIGPEHLGIAGTLSAAAREGPLPNCTLPELEHRLIQQALERTDRNVSQAARLLGISRGALRRRLESMGQS